MCCQGMPLRWAGCGISRELALEEPAIDTNVRQGMLGRSWRITGAPRDKWRELA